MVATIGGKRITIENDRLDTIPTIPNDSYHFKRTDASAANKTVATAAAAIFEPERLWLLFPRQMFAYGIGDVLQQRQTEKRPQQQLGATGSYWAAKTYPETDFINDKYSVILKQKV